MMCKDKKGIVLVLALLIIVSSIPKRTSANNLRSYDMSDFIQPTDPMVQQIIRQVCKFPLGKYLVSNIQSLYYWVAWNIEYMSDENRWGEIDYWQLPSTTINLRTGDCEDQAILLASLIRGIGYPRDRVHIALAEVKWIWGTLVGYHAYVEIKMPSPAGSALALSANESATQLREKKVAFHLNETVAYSNFTAERLSEIQTLGWGSRQGWIPIDTTAKILPFIPVPWFLWMWFGYWIYYAGLTKVEPYFFEDDQGDYMPIFWSPIIFEIANQSQYNISVLNEMPKSGDYYLMASLEGYFSSSSPINFEFKDPKGQTIDKVYNVLNHNFTAFLEINVDPLFPRDLGFFELKFYNPNQENVCVNLTLGRLLLVWLGMDGAINKTFEDEYNLWTVAVQTTSFEAAVNGQIYEVEITSSSNISSFDFNKSLKQISFNVTGPVGTTGFSEVIIPKSLLQVEPSDSWAVLFDKHPIIYTKTENSTYTFIYFTYDHSTHKVEIIGTWVVPEFPSAMILPLLIILVLIGAVISKKTWIEKLLKTRKGE